MFFFFFIYFIVGGYKLSAALIVLKHTWIHKEIFYFMCKIFSIVFISLACACAVHSSMFNAFYFVSFHTCEQKLTIWNFVKILLQKVFWCIHYIHWLWHTVCVSWLWAVCHLQKTSSWNPLTSTVCVIMWPSSEHLSIYLNF